MQGAVPASTSRRIDLTKDFHSIDWEGMWNTIFKLDLAEAEKKHNHNLQPHGLSYPTHSLPSNEEINCINHENMNLYSLQQKTDFKKKVLIL